MTTDCFDLVVLEFLENYLLAAVLPLSVPTGHLWIYLHMMSPLTWCYVSYALT